MIPAMGFPGDLMQHVYTRCARCITKMRKRKMVHYFDDLNDGKKYMYMKSMSPWKKPHSLNLGLVRIFWESCTWDLYPPKFCRPYQPSSSLRYQPTPPATALAAARVEIPKNLNLRIAIRVKWSWLSRLSRHNPSSVFQLTTWNLST